MFCAKIPYLRENISVKVNHWTDFYQVLLIILLGVFYQATASHFCSL